jgi:hypothetical protein
MKNINDRNMARFAAFNQPKHRLLKRGNILLLPVIAMMERLLSIDIDKAMRDMMVLLASGCNLILARKWEHEQTKGHPHAFQTTAFTTSTAAVAGRFCGRHRAFRRTVNGV